MDVETQLRQPPEVSGAEGADGHLGELRSDPIGLMRRVRQECGDVGEFRLADRRVVLLTGAEVNEKFFRASEEELNQAEAYPFMTPIFGKGVVFDAPPERRAEMLHNQSLKDRYMRGHAQKIATEVTDMVAGWDRGGEIDLLDFFAELTIYTSSSCLIGKKFRDQLDGRFAELYHDLERGTDAIAYVDPYAPIESFRRRDAARADLVSLVEGIMAARAAGPRPTEEDRDLLDVLMAVPAEGAGEGAPGSPKANPRFSADEIAGIFISMMFAGHHTTSGTAAWTLIELLRHPQEMAAITAELDELYADRADVSYQALREMPLLEAAIKEALRLHPPLILVLRVAKEPLAFGGFHVAPGTMVGASPAISNRIPEHFPDPDAFVPARYLDPRREDLANPWTWIPFGAGKHRCVGAAFATMQLKAIFSVLLRGWTFELSQPSESYRNDHSKMVVQLRQPCRARYRARESS